MALFYVGKTNVPLRNLTSPFGFAVAWLSGNPTKSADSPHIVIMICSYLRGFNLNLSEATLNILTTRIKCSTKIRNDASSLFRSFCYEVSSAFLGFFLGVLIDDSPS